MGLQLGPRGWSEKNARFRVAFAIIQAWGEENMFWTKSVPVGRQRKSGSKDSSEVETGLVN